MAQPLRDRLDAIAEDSVADVVRSHAPASRWARFRNAIADAWDSWLLNEGDHELRSRILDARKYYQQLAVLKALQEEGATPTRISEKRAYELGILPEDIGLDLVEAKKDHEEKRSAQGRMDDSDHSNDSDPLTQDTYRVIPDSDDTTVSVSLQEAIDYLKVQKITPLQVDRLAHDRDTFNIDQYAKTEEFSLSFWRKLQLYFDTGKAENIDAFFLIFSKIIGLIFFAIEATFILAQKCFNLIVDIFDIPAYLKKDRHPQFPQTVEDAETATHYDLENPFKSSSLIKSLKILINLPIGLIRSFLHLLYKAFFEISGENGWGLTVLRMAAGLVFIAIGLIGSLALELSILNLGLPFVAIGIMLLGLGAYRGFKTWQNLYPSGEVYEQAHLHRRRLNFFPQANNNHRAEYVDALNTAEDTNGTWYTIMNVKPDVYHVFSNSPNSKKFVVKKVGLDDESRPVYDIYCTHTFGFWDMLRIGHRSITLQYKKVDGRAMWEPSIKLPELSQIFKSEPLDALVTSINELNKKRHIFPEKKYEKDLSCFDREKVFYVFEPQAGPGLYYMQIIGPNETRQLPYGTYHRVGNTVRRTPIGTSGEKSEIKWKEPNYYLILRQAFKRALDSHIRYYHDKALKTDKGDESDDEKDEKVSQLEISTLGQLYEVLKEFQSSNNHNDIERLKEKCTVLFEMLGLATHEYEVRSSTSRFFNAKFKANNLPEFKSHIYKARNLLSKGEFFEAVFGLQKALKIAFIQKLLSKFSDDWIEPKTGLLPKVLTPSLIQADPESAIKKIEQTLPLQVGEDIWKEYQEILSDINDLYLAKAMQEIHHLKVEPSRRMSSADTQQKERENKENPWYRRGSGVGGEEVDDGSLDFLRQDDRSDVREPLTDLDGGFNF